MIFTILFILPLNTLFLNILYLFGPGESILNMSYRKLRKQLPIKGAFMRRIMITGFAERFL